jgi:hypothetical protein
MFPRQHLLFVANRKSIRPFHRNPHRELTMNMTNDKARYSHILLHLSIPCIISSSAAGLAACSTLHYLGQQISSQPHMTL